MPKQYFVLKINQERYDIFKCLYHACSRDITVRRTLGEIWYDHKKSRFVACDGHILRCVYWHEVFGDDKAPKFSFFLPKKDFSLNLSAFKKYHEIKGRHDSRAVLELKVSRPGKHDDQYPKYSKAFPSREEGDLSSVVLDLNYLVQLHKTWPSSVQTAVSFKPSGKLSAIAVYRRNHQSTDPNKICGLIMPIRPSDEEV